MDLLGGSIPMEGNTDQALQLVFRSKEHILNIELINGHMRTPKKSQLVKLIEFVNFHGWTTSPIFSLGLYTAGILHNAWLTGMSECDSSFQIQLNTVRHANGTLYPLVKVTWELFQSCINLDDLNAYKPIMA